MDVKKLSVVVEQKGIAPTTKNLERLAKASDTASPAVQKLSSALGSLQNTQLGGMGSSVQTLATAMADFRTSVKGAADVAKSFTGLSANLTNIANAADRIQGKLSSLDAFAKKLRKIRDELIALQGLSSSITNINIPSSSGSSGTRGGGSTNQQSTTSTTNLTTSQAQLMRQLERTALMAGRTRSEYLAARAAQLGLTASAAPFIAQMRLAEGQMRNIGEGTRAYAANLRMVPAQFTDIATQLAGGQNPLLILLQQGGQIRDMFGSVSLAIKAVGTALLSMATAVLTNPYILLATAIAAVGYAMYSASQQSKEFNNALISTGNMAGLTRDSFDALSVKIAGGAGNTLAARDALLAVAKSGQIASENVELVATSALRMSKVTGDSVESVVEKFVSLQNDPVSAIESISKTMNIFDADIIKTVASLVKQGKEFEAGKVAVESFATEIKKRSEESVANIGYIGKAVKGVVDSFKSMYQGVMDWGKQASDAEKLAEAVVKVSDAQTNINYLAGRGAGAAVWGKDINAYKEELKAANAVVAGIKAKQLADTNAAQAASKKAAADKAAGDFNKELDTISTQYADNKTKQTLELTKLENKRQEAIAKGIVVDEAAYQKARQAILNASQFQDKTAASAAGKAQKKYDQQAKEIAGVRAILSTEKERYSQLTEFGLRAETAAEAEISLAKQNAIIKDKGVSADKRAHAERMVALLEEVAAQQNVNKQFKADLQSREDYNNLITEQSAGMADLAEQYRIELEQSGMTTEELAKSNALRTEQLALKKALLDIDKKMATVPTDSEQYTNLLASKEAVKEYYSERSKLIEENIALQQQELSWEQNLEKAFTQYRNGLGTTNNLMQTGMLSVFGTLETALTDFVSGTKTSFKDLAVSVLKQIAVMLAKMAVMKLAMAAVGMLSSGSVGSTSAVQALSDESSAIANATSSFSLASAKGNAFTGSGVAKFAKGGAFTNKVVNKATPMMFADGAGFSAGIIGEKAGSPGEAVMPLSRMSNGNLGVETSGNSGVVNNVGVTVNVASDGTATSSTTSDTQSNAKSFGELIAAKVKETITQEQRPGGLLATR